MLKLILLFGISTAFSLKLQGTGGACPPWKPFPCPDGECIPLKYLCDGNADCKSNYDEDGKMCTAAARPPVQETVEFLKALLNGNGPDFFVKIFGDKGRSGLKGLGGVEAVAVALSESATADEFGLVLGMNANEIAHVRKVLEAISDNNVDVESELGIQRSQNDLKFLADRLVQTGFLRTSTSD